MNGHKSAGKIYELFLENSHTQTFLACFWMLVGSFLPILVDSAIKSWAFSMNYYSAFLGNIKGGEVFILTTAMITPFFWLLLRKISGKVKVKFKMFSLVFAFSLFSLVGGVLSFSYFRIGELISSEELNINESAKDYLVGLFSYDLTFLGFLIYGASLFVWYYAAYHDNAPNKSFSDTVSSGQEALNNKVFGK